MRIGQLVEIVERAGNGIRELLRARTYAASDLWQFSVEIGQLNLLGLSHSDLRLLVEAGYLLHAREVTKGDSPKREFTRIASLSFSRATCFVLTDQGQTLCQSANEVPNDAASKAMPCWDVESRELRVGSALVKRYRCPALNQETVLSVFQEERWPNRIDDPLPPLAEREPKRRLHDAIKSLNKNQINRLIRFRGDGTGQGVTWELLDPAARAYATQASPSHPHVACSDDDEPRYNDLHKEVCAASKEEERIV